MLSVGKAVNLSASDLVGHLNCRYLTSLDLAVANGALPKPSIWDPVLELLALLWSKATVVNVAEKSEQDFDRYD